MAYFAAAAEAQLTKLEAYKREHGDCNVPQGWAEDPRLANFVQKQRAEKKVLDRGGASPGLTAARVAKLDAIGFTWEMSAVVRRKQRSEGRRDDAGWECWLANLQRYKSRHGDCNVPACWPEDPSLTRWVSSQRRFKKALDRGDPFPQISAARVARLEALGFEWNFRLRVEDACWEAKLAKLAQYKRRHGDCIVPQRWAEDKQLGNWVHDQRARKKKLDKGEPSDGMTAARAVKLEALGFAWAQPG